MFAPHLVLILYINLPKLPPKNVPSVSRRASAYAWLHDQLSRIQVNGQRTIGYHNQQVEGDGDAFNSLNYYGQGSSRFTDIGMAQITGRKVLGVLNFDFQLANNRFGDPQAQHTSLNYENNGFTADLGDIHGHLLNTNMFATFSKTLRGAMVGYKVGGLEARVVRSNVKGSARTVSLQGNGGPGPYYLNANQVIQDSEQVRVDDQPMRLGQDYTMDYQVGAITFVNRSIAQTSTILVSFEELGVNSSFGTIQGGGLAYSLGKLGKVGFTHVEQLAGGAAGLGNRTDLFQGFGAPETPYYLQFEPLLTAPVIVKLDGRVQTQNIDYRFDTGNPTIFYFLRFIPDTSTIEVTYTPKPTATVNGSRRVSGWDYQLPFKGGQITYSQATGKLFDTPTPSDGTARGINFDYRWKKWDFRSSVKDVPQGFVGIETQGFNRNERSSTWTLANDAGRVHYSLSGANSAISSRTINSDGSTAFLYGRTTSLIASTDYSGSRGVNYNFSQSHLTSSAAGSDTKLDLTTLSATKGFGKLNTQWTLQRTAGMGLVADNQGNTTEGRVTSNSLGLTSKYQAGQGWSFSGKYSLADTQSQAIHGTGTDMNVSLGYHPSKGSFSSDLSFVNSRAGTLAALSQFSNGYGFGYDGGGFSSPVAGSGLTSGPTNAKILNLVSDFRLNSKARLNSHVGTSEMTGNVSSNTQSFGFGTGVQLELGRSTNFSLSLENSRTSYIGSDQRSANTTMDTSLVGSFGRKWSYQLSSSLLLSSGGNYAQNRWAYDTSISRRISSLERLTFQVQNGRSFGYQPQLDGYVGLSYSRNIFNGIALIGSYRIRNLNYLDGNTNTGGYRSRGFDLELSFDFGR